MAAPGDARLVQEQKQWKQGRDDSLAREVFEREAQTTRDLADREER